MLNSSHKEFMNSVDNKINNDFQYAYLKHFWNRYRQHIHQLLIIMHQSERKYMVLLLLSKFNMAIAAMLKLHII